MQRRFHHAKKKYKSRSRLEKKPILRRRLFWDFILALILALSVSYFLLLSQGFKVKNIKIAGAENVLAEELVYIIEKEAGRKSLFLINSQKIEEEILTEYPEIASAHLARDFPRTLILEIEERKPVALLGADNQEDLLLIDSKGVVFQGPFQEGLPLIFSQVSINEAILNQILRIESIIMNKLAIPLEKFVLESIEKLTVQSQEGWQIYFDLTTDIEMALKKLELLLDKEILPEQTKNLEYIDLRFSKVYYKYK